MAAAGLLKQTDDTLAASVRCGLELAAISQQLEWEMRVGVHVGPVVAGIVGQERYQFDIWGDTVNVVVWRHIADRFDGEILGQLEVAGKGALSLVEVRGESRLSRG
jgi:adenylate cyclase